MVKKDVIAVVTEPTEWVSQMVAAKKKDKDEVRICIDPRDLNDAILRPHHPMRTIEEVEAKMPEAKYFAVIDAKTGFWQIPLDENFSMYTAFNTPFGRYRFKHMPYGIKSGSEVFQRAMEELFIHSPCEIVVDDILIWGKTMDELKSNTYKVLDRAREVGLKLNANKCKFGVTEVTYVGHKLTSNRLKPDPAKIRAVKDMPKPKEKADVQRFLGVVNYLSKFILDFSTKTASSTTNTQR